MKYEVTQRDRMRFLGKVSFGDDHQCWSWNGSHFKATGYALFNIRHHDGVWRPTPAHRIAVIVSGRTIPDGWHVDHLCRNRWCVNPNHLEVVTPRTNNLRGQSPAAMQAKQTHCKNGHAFTPDNTYTKPGTNKRECRECMRQRDRRRSASRRGYVPPSRRKSA